MCGKYKNKIITLKEVSHGVVSRSKRQNEPKVGSGYLYDHVVHELETLAHHYLDIAREQTKEEKGSYLPLPRNS